MASSIKIVNDQLICNKYNHNSPIKMIAMDYGILFYDRLLCSSCFQAKGQVTKYISINKAEELIKEERYKFSCRLEEQQNILSQNLNLLLNKISDLKSKLFQSFEEIISVINLWIAQVQNNQKKSEENNNLIQNLQSYFQGNLHLNCNYDFFNTISQSYYQKIDQLSQKLMAMEEYKSFLNQMKDILHIPNIQQEIQHQDFINVRTNANQTRQRSNSVKEKKFLVKHVKLVNNVKQCESSYAIAFNQSGSIMATGSHKDIKLWMLDQGKLIEKAILYGHCDHISCIVFSKKYNWCFSGSKDCNIRSWKEKQNKDWDSFEAEKKHTNTVICLLLNKKEDKLISCSYDHTIQVWNVNYQANNLQHEYSLQIRHQSYVFSIALNEQENFLVSCGYDRKIILWRKENNEKYEYMNEIIMNEFGYRICFISENQIAWQQYNQGITQILELRDRNLIINPNLNVKLNQKQDDDDAFPIIVNQLRQIIVLKHNQYVYIIQKQTNGKLRIVAEPIDCNNKHIYGGLTQDGETLIIWNFETKEFRVYNIKYE